MFWLSTVVGISAILNAPVKPLLDSAIMSILPDKSAYGRSRLYGQLGMGLGSFLVDTMIKGNIRVMYFLHFLLSIPTAFLMTLFDSNRMANSNQGAAKDISNKPSIALSPVTSTNSPVSTLPSNIPQVDPLESSTKKQLKERNMKELLKALQLTLSDSRVAVFFLIVFIIGVSSGIIENFAYVRLGEISKGDKSAFGTLRLVSSMTGAPMFWLSGNVIHLLGVNGVMILSLISYVIRFFLYGQVKNIWHALPAEMLRGFTFALFWSGSTYYASQIAPKHLTATMVRSFIPSLPFTLPYHKYYYINVAFFLSNYSLEY